MFIVRSVLFDLYRGERERVRTLFFGRWNVTTLQLSERAAPSQTFPHVGIALAAVLLIFAPLFLNTWVNIIASGTALAALLMHSYLTHDPALRKYTLIAIAASIVAAFVAAAIG